MNTWPRNFRYGWNPWEEMDQLSRELHRALTGYSGYGAAREFPAVNIWTNEDTASLSAELPGVDPASLDISVQNDTVTIKGERPVPEHKEGENWVRQERAYGAFTRSFALPFRIDPEHVTANCAHGVLTVTLPRVPEERTRKIDIRVD